MHLKIQDLHVYDLIYANKMQDLVNLHSGIFKTQPNARIDSDPILAFLCISFLCLVMKHHNFHEYFHVTQARRNTTHVPLRHIVNRPLGVGNARAPHPLYELLDLNI